MSITECFEGFYGENCSLNCTCSSNAVCDSTSGNCSCSPGFTGGTCDESKSMYPIFYNWLIQDL